MGGFTAKCREDGRLLICRSFFRVLLEPLETSPMQDYQWLGSVARESSCRIVCTLTSEFHY